MSGEAELFLIEQRLGGIEETLVGLVEVTIRQQGVAEYEALIQIRQLSRGAQLTQMQHQRITELRKKLWPETERTT